MPYVTRGYSPADLPHVFARLLLKSNGIADRVVLDGDKVQLQQWDGSEWVPFRLEEVVEDAGELPSEEAQGGAVPAFGR